MSTVADTYKYVIGVDTHAKTHTYAVVAAATGAVIDTASFPTTDAGTARAIAW
ncbi:IS110 family transposase, partial [Cryobacterium sp. 10C2]|nr:IS110 family transposase [Cryobacterium sp. 10C2]